MFFGVGVGAVRGDEVADPTERSASSYPKAWREDQPKYSRQNASVVELTNSGNDETKDAGEHWIAHDLNLRAIKYERVKRFVRKKFFGPARPGACPQTQ